MSLWHYCPPVSERKHGYGHRCVVITKLESHMVVVLETFEFIAQSQSWGIDRNFCACYFGAKGTSGHWRFPLLVVCSRGEHSAACDFSLVSRCLLCPKDLSSSVPFHSESHLSFQLTCSSDASSSSKRQERQVWRWFCRISVQLCERYSAVICLLTSLWSLLSRWLERINITA